MSKKNSLAILKSLTRSLFILAVLSEICIATAVPSGDLALGERRELEESVEKTKKRSWTRLLLTYLILQAIIGIAAFEWAYSKVYRFREVDEAREAYFTAVRRQDAPHWRRWKFYPGAMFTMPTRVVLLFLGIVVLFICLQVLTIGHNFDKGPMPDGCRKRLIRNIYRACCGSGIFFAGMSTSVTYQDVDYSYYLGPGYKSKYRDIERTSTIVCNHVSWLDSLILIYIVTPAFAPSAYFKSVPVFNTTCNVLDSIYIDRGGDDAARQKVVETIVHR